HGHIVLRERHWRVRAVNPATRRSVDETFNSTPPSMLENFQDPHAIDNEVEFRMVHRVLVREVCRQMVNHLRRLPENSPEDFVVNDVASDETNPLPFRKIPLIGRCEIVEDRDPFNRKAIQARNEARADRSGASGYQDRLALKGAGSLSRGFSRQLHTPSASIPRFA